MLAIVLAVALTQDGSSDSAAARGPAKAPVRPAPIDPEAQAAWAGTIEEVCHTLLADAVASLAGGDESAASAGFKATAQHIGALTAPRRYAETTDRVVAELERAAGVYEGSQYGPAEQYVRAATERMHAFGATSC
jgi:hypothetical protein